MEVFLGNENDQVFAERISTVLFFFLTIKTKTILLPITEQKLK